MCYTINEVVKRWISDNNIDTSDEAIEQLIDQTWELLESRCPEGWPYCRVKEGTEND